MFVLSVRNYFSQQIYEKLSKSEYWHFKISWKHCQENFQFSRRDFFGLQDFDISTRSYLTSCRDSRRGCGRLDFGISRRSYLKSCRDSRRVFGRWGFQISSRSRRESRRESRWESRRVFGRRDFKILPRSRRESRQDFEISPRSRRESRWVFGRRDLVENLTEISAISPAKNSPRFSPRSRSKFCRGWKKMIEEQNNLHNKLIH